jgi:phosphoenolpyruvate phosphomutase
MRAIIVAAGMGRRLAPHTDDRPKCLVEIAGKSILERQIDAYRAAGVDEIAIVRGYMAERVQVAGCRYFENRDFARNNILASLFHAEPAMAGGFYFSYSDIVFRPEVVRQLAASEGDFALVVDRRWDEAYVGRTLHPESEAELARVDGTGRVLRVGKRQVERAQAHGEFIGLARFSARAAEVMRDDYRRLERELGRDAPFGAAPRFEVAYLTDLLNHLIDSRGERMQSVDIDGGWREIDTPQDLERARAIVDW